MKYTDPLISDKSEYYIYTPSRSSRDMFFYPLQCGHFYYLKDYIVRRDSFDSFLILYVQSGHLFVTLNGESQPVPEGSFLLLDCYHPHCYSTDSACECLWCHFDGPLAAAWCSSIISRCGNILSVPDSSYPLSRLTSIYETFSKSRLVREPLLSKHLTDMLTSFLLHTATEKNVRSYTAMAEETITYINENFTRDLSTEYLASRAGLSQYHFIRTFKRETGFTPHEYLVHTRMATARYLLKNTEMSVKDICFSSGFSSESVFCNAFKKELGVTPAGYRNQL